MFLNASTKHCPSWPGLVFKFPNCLDVIPGSPNGIWIEGDVIRQDCVLRERTVNNVIYRFVIEDPGIRCGSDAFTKPLHSDTSDWKAGYQAQVSLYAEVVENVNLAELIDQAIRIKVDSAELLQLAKKMITNGLDEWCNFRNVLYHEFDQYWLRTPIYPDCLLYYHKPTSRWATLDIPWYVDHAANRLSREGDRCHEHILIKMITEADLERLTVAQPVAEPSFAEDMMATALIELHKDRLRSAIVHAVIGYESAAKRGLSTLLRTLEGLNSGSVLEAISREVSLVTLGKVVFDYTNPVAVPPLDWSKIKTLCEARNQIVHKNRRRMPPYDLVRDQILEVRTYVEGLQAALAVYNDETE